MSRSSNAPKVDSDDESHSQIHRQSKLYELFLQRRDQPSCVRVHMLDIQMNSIDSHLLLLTDLTHEIEQTTLLNSQGANYLMPPQFGTRIQAKLRQQLSIPINFTKSLIKDNKAMAKQLKCVTSAIVLARCNLDIYVSKTTMLDRTPPSEQ